MSSEPEEKSSGGVFQRPKCLFYFIVYWQLEGDTQHTFLFRLDRAVGVTVFLPHFAVPQQADDQQDHEQQAAQPSQ